MPASGLSCRDGRGPTRQLRLTACTADAQGTTRGLVSGGKRRTDTGYADAGVRCPGYHAQVRHYGPGRYGLPFSVCRIRELPQIGRQRLSDTTARRCGNGISGLRRRILGLFTVDPIRQRRDRSIFLSQVSRAETYVFRPRSANRKITFKQSSNGTRNIFKRRTFEIIGRSRR